MKVIGIGKRQENKIKITEIVCKIGLCRSIRIKEKKVNLIRLLVIIMYPQCTSTLLARLSYHITLLQLVRYTK